MEKPQSNDILKAIDAATRKINTLNINDNLEGNEIKLEGIRKNINGILDSLKQVEKQDKGRLLFRKNIKTLRGLFTAKEQSLCERGVNQLYKQIENIRRLKGNDVSKGIIDNIIKVQIDRLKASKLQKIEQDIQMLIKQRRAQDEIIKKTGKIAKFLGNGYLDITKAKKAIVKINKQINSKKRAMEKNNKKTKIRFVKQVRDGFLKKTIGMGRDLLGIPATEHKHSNAYLTRLKNFSEIYGGENLSAELTGIVRNVNQKFNEAGKVFRRVKEYKKQYINITNTLDVYSVFIFNKKSHIENFKRAAYFKNIEESETKFTALQNKANLVMASQQKKLTTRIKKMNDLLEGLDRGAIDIAGSDNLVEKGNYDKWEKHVGGLTDLLIEVKKSLIKKKQAVVKGKANKKKITAGGKIQKPILSLPDQKNKAVQKIDEFVLWCHYYAEQMTKRGTAISIKQSECFEKAAQNDCWNTIKSNIHNSKSTYGVMELNTSIEIAISNKIDDLKRKVKPSVWEVIREMFSNVRVFFKNLRLKEKDKIPKAIVIENMFVKLPAELKKQLNQKSPVKQQKIKSTIKGVLTKLQNVMNANDLTEMKNHMRKYKIKEIDSYFPSESKSLRNDLSAVIKKMKVNYNVQQNAKFIRVCLQNAVKNKDFTEVDAIVTLCTSGDDYKTANEKSREVMDEIVSKVKAVMKKQTKTDNLLQSKNKIINVHGNVSKVVKPKPKTTSQLINPLNNKPS